MTKITFYKISLMSVLLLVLAACGGGGGGGGSSSDDRETVTINVVAEDDLQVNRAATIDLDASATTISTNAALSYQWEQIAGTDVTGGQGHLSGVGPTLVAPASVETLVFRLTARDASNNSASRIIKVNVLEDLNTALYVDGDHTGTEDGSRDNPFTSISAALAHIQNNTLNDYDIYVSNLNLSAAYDETGATLTVANGTSLYGGYDKQWVRDAASTPTLLNGHAQAIHFDQVDQEAWLSGFDIQSADTVNADDNAYVVKIASGSATINLENNLLSAGDVASALSSTPGSSYGVVIQQVNAAKVSSNTILAGNGGNGENGTRPASANDGGDGVNASGKSYGTYGSGGVSFRNGGRGGQGGDGNGGNGENGLSSDGREFPNCVTGCGGTGGSGGFGDGTRGTGGSFAYGGAGGDGGTGGKGAGTIDANAFFKADISTAGTAGEHARGGGGGGGGGGEGGGGGSPGIAAGASIGISIRSVNNALISENIITSATGGNGGQGGDGGDSGDGGDGGNGGNGDNPSFRYDGGGGGGGAGGAKGGRGGPGAGGAGGPSYAIAIGSSVIATIEDNVLTSGTGGNFGPTGARGLAGRAGTDGSNGSGRSGGSGGTGATEYQTTGQGSPGISAESGYSFAMYDFDLTDATPLVSGNTFNVGSSGSSTGEKNW